MYRRRIKTAPVQGNNASIYYNFLKEALSTRKNRSIGIQKSFLKIPQRYLIKKLGNC